MRKKIVLFSDGTSNSSSKAQKTNVWRLFEALDQERSDQIAMYDNGVGTSSNKYLAAIGMAFGWGLKRNVIDLYKFVCRNFAPGDDIYGFGFSRGSFTIRVLVGLISREGLVTFRSEEDLNRNAAAAYRHYRSASFRSWSPIVWGMRRARDLVIRAWIWVRGYQSYDQVAQATQGAARTEIRIKFLGLWDTVEAYGMPIDELKRGIDWVLWPMMFGDLKLSPLVDRACHALSLDDERTTFHPLLWDEAAEAQMLAAQKVKAGRITQVWFAGVHANVGGGYPEDQLSLVSLQWMISMADGLALVPSVVAQVIAAKSPYARLYDSRAGFGAYYRYSPRQIPIFTYQDQGKTQLILPIVHGSAVMRMAHGSDGYAPISLPHQFWVLAPDGELLPMTGFSKSLHLAATKKKFVGTINPTQQIKDDKDCLQSTIAQLVRPDEMAVAQVWDTVWWRRLLYTLTVALTCVLAAYPWVGGRLTQATHWLLSLIPLVGGPLDEFLNNLVSQFDAGSRGPISNTIDAVSAFIPGYASRWTKAFVDHPLEFGSLLVAILFCLYGSGVLDERIRDRARLAWHPDRRPSYLAWYLQGLKGARNGVFVALFGALSLLLAAFEWKWPTIAKSEIGVAAAILAMLWLLRIRKVSSVETQIAQPTNESLPTTFALSLAGKLRGNRFLEAIGGVVFAKAVPIAFAVGLLLTGALLANRAMFDGFSAAGYFCRGGVTGNATKREKLGSKDGFNTEDMCWPSGLVLVEGGRYRITLIAKDDWFDKTIRTDVGGFPADSLRHYSATPLKRWWGQNWFKPIARIGTIGNDEYVLDPIVPLEPHAYDACPAIPRETDGDGVRAKLRAAAAKRLAECEPTPVGRKTLVSEITARTSGELFLYVNDAVLMWPTATDIFFANNRGTATLAVKRIEVPLTSP